MGHESWPNLPFDDVAFNAMRTLDQARFELKGWILVGAAIQQQCQ
jgi:hypothetical protein